MIGASWFYAMRGPAGFPAEGDEKAESRDKRKIDRISRWKSLLADSSLSPYGSHLLFSWFLS
jgi:hypothetical protein